MRTSWLLPAVLLPAAWLAAPAERTQAAAADCTESGQFDLDVRLADESSGWLWSRWLQFEPPPSEPVVFEFSGRWSLHRERSGSGTMTVTPAQLAAALPDGAETGLDGQVMVSDSPIFVHYNPSKPMATFSIGFNTD